MDVESLKLLQITSEDGRIFLVGHDGAHSRPILMQLRMTCNCVSSSRHSCFCRKIIWHLQERLHLLYVVRQQQPHIQAILVLKYLTSMLNAILSVLLLAKALQSHAVHALMQQLAPRCKRWCHRKQ